MSGYRRAALTRSDQGVFEGRYLFHLHTRYTDGELTIPEYFEFARQADVDRLVFLEHIRRNPTYAAAGFAAEVKSCSATAGVPASIGFEAKLLPNGTLDIDERDREMADVIGIAEHGFPDDFDLLRRSLDRVFEALRPLAGEKETVWVHPGLWMKRRGVLAERAADYRQMIVCALQCGIRIERNLRYGLISPTELMSLGHLDTIIGADAHRPEDLARWRDLAEAGFDGRHRALHPACTPSEVVSTR